MKALKWLAQGFSMRVLLCIATAVCSLAANAQSVNLNEGWKFLKKDVTQAKLGTTTGWEDVSLPHTWNALDGQDGGNNYYRGVGWYRKTISVPAEATGNVAYLNFAAANMQTTVYVDGKEIGTHIGGYARFMFDVTEALAGKTQAVVDVKVDNSSSIMSPPLGGDFTFFGGITRDLSLDLLPPVHIAPIHNVKTSYLTKEISVAHSGVTVKQSNVSKTSATIDVKVQLRNALDTEASRKVVVTIYNKENEVQATAEQDVMIGEGSATTADLQLTMTNPHLWNGKKDPYMHRVVVELKNGTAVEHQVTQPLGVRFFEINKTKGFILNGEEYPLRGIAIHDASKDKGRAVSDADRKLDLDLMLETGANYIRLSHYQHGDFTYDYLDEKGIICWTEIPVVEQTAPNTTSHSEFLQNCTSQLYELIRQCENHPSVICWGVANEIRQASSVNQKAVVDHLNKVVHSEDSRPSALAHNGWYEECAVTDIVSFNIYQGWYGGSITGFGGAVDGYNGNTKHPVGVSEYGAGGNIHQHEYPANKPTTTGAWHPEEYMNAYHEGHLQQIATRKYLWQTSVWVGIDFASDHRAEGSQPGINDKGLVTYDRAVKKDVFYLYKAYWNEEEPTLYITSRRYVDREGTTVPVRVYTNCDQVTLYVNDTEVGTVAAKNHIAEWTSVTGVVGENKIKVKGTYDDKEVTDEVVWNFKEAVDPTEMAEAEIQVNFAKAGTNVDGYMLDCGEEYGKRDNGYTYGWDVDMTSQTRERTSYKTDKRMATFVQMQPTTAPVGNHEWSIKLPNGKYRVGVSVGDNDYTDSHHVIEANGVQVVAFSPASTKKFGAGTAECEVTDGKLVLAPALSSSNAKINFVHIHCLSIDPVESERQQFFASVTPEDGSTVDALETIEIVTTAQSLSGIDKDMQLLNSKDEVVYEGRPEEKAQYTLVLKPGITESGTYTLVIPEQCIRLAGVPNSYEHRFTFRVKNPNDVSYATNFDGKNSTHTGRKTESVKLVSPAHGMQSINTTQTIGGKLVFDLTETEDPFKCAPGESLSVSVGFTGAWMNAYVYIDENGNGFEASDENIGDDHVLKTGTDIDLRTYSKYNGGPNNKANYDSKGNALSTGNTLAMPDIKAPETPGTYRMRYKVDWNNIDPKGATSSNEGGSMQDNGGIIVDVLLCVTDEEVPGEEDPDYRVPVYLFAGQSNMDGRAAVSDYPQYMQDYAKRGAEYARWSYCNGSDWAWSTFGGKFWPYQPYSDNNTLSRTGFDGVVYHMIEEELQTRFYVIKESLGGTAIDPRCTSTGNRWWCADADWLATHEPRVNGGSLTKEFTENIALCIDNVLGKLENGYDIKCIVWHQGCSDRTQAESYKENLRVLVNHLRNKIAAATGDERYLRLPFICCNINPLSTQYSDVVDQAKHELAEEMDNFYEVSFADCELGSDNLHHSAAGNIEGAERVFKLMKELQLISIDADWDAVEKVVAYDSADSQYYDLSGRPVRPDTNAPVVTRGAKLIK